MKDEIHFIPSCGFILVTHIGRRGFFCEVDGAWQLCLCAWCSCDPALWGGMSLHHLRLSLMLGVQVLWVFSPLQRRFGIAAQIFSECADTNVLRQACRCGLANTAVMAKKKVLNNWLINQTCRETGEPERTSEQFSLLSQSRFSSEDFN